MAVKNIIKTVTGSTRRAVVQRAVLMLFGVLVLPIVGFTGSAGAATCSANYVCLYENAHFEGLSTHYYNPSSGCRNLNSFWSDRISSLKNNTNYRIRFWVGTDCFGFYQTYDPGEWVDQLNSYNDSFSSWGAYHN